MAGLDRVDRALSPLNPDGVSLIRNIVVRYNENADAGTSGAYLATINLDVLEGEIRAATTSICARLIARLL